MSVQVSPPLSSLSAGGSSPSGTPAASLAGSSPSGMPVVSPASEPEFVRNGSAAVKSAYQEAVGFEAMLVEELAKSMAQTGGLGEGAEEGQGEGADGTEGAGAGAMGLVTSMLPQTLSEAVTRGGGLGLASQLTREIDPGIASEGAQPVGGGASAGLGGRASVGQGGRASAGPGAGASA